MKGGFLVFTLLLAACVGIASAHAGHVVDGQHNPDYKHTKEEEEEHRKDFNSFDVNNDGNIDAFEVRAGIPDIEQQELTTFFLVADKNEDGLVNFDEYLHASFRYTDEDLAEISKDPYALTEGKSHS